MNRKESWIAGLMVTWTFLLPAAGLTTNNTIVKESIGTITFGTPEFETILNNGLVKDNIDLVFVGDGYTSSQMTEYKNDVTTLYNHIFSIEPFSSKQSRFNVYRINAVSIQAGSDHPDQNIYVNTAFDTYYVGKQIRTDNRVNLDIAKSKAPAADIVIMVVNDSTYGGSGGYPSIGYNGTWMKEVGAHEFGHYFAKLEDESAQGSTGTYSGPELVAPNVTINTDPATSKWKHLLGTDPLTGAQIGFFEGAALYLKGAYRPTFNNCMMNEFKNYFCAVCRERISYVIDQFSEQGPPKKPTMPSGPANGGVNQSLKYSTVSNAFDVGYVFYIFDWGDGTTSATQWIPSGVAASMSHAWTSPGTYTVKVKAIDDLDNAERTSLSSDWSDSIQVTISGVELALTVYGDTRGWYGETRNQRALVVNNGVASSSQTGMKVYFSRDELLDSGDILVGSYSVPALAPSASVRIDYAFSLPSSWPQRMVYVLAVVDPDNKISEIDETNNTKYRSIGYGKMPYDVDGSGLVTVSDTNEVVQAYFTGPGDLKWNSSADTTRDGIIRIEDILAANNHYLEVDSQVELHASVSATTIMAGQTVKFTYEAHYFYGSVAVLIDPDSNVSSGWDFNSGTVANETKGTWSFKYNTKGTYTAKVLGWDSNWKTETAIFTITVQ